MIVKSINEWSNRQSNKQLENRMAKTSSFFFKQQHHHYSHTSNKKQKNNKCTYALSFSKTQHPRATNSFIRSFLTRISFFDFRCFRLFWREWSEWLALQVLPVEERDASRHHSSSFPRRAWSKSHDKPSSLRASGVTSPWRKLPHVVEWWGILDYTR